MKFKALSKIFKRPPPTPNNQASAASRVSQSTPAVKPPSIKVVHGDITRLKADAIVNAANTGLMAGGGVCGAIFTAAEPDDQKLQQACSKHKGCDVGDAKITSGKFGSLDCKHIIHAVGPDCRVADQNQNRDEFLGSAYRKAIKLADKAKCTSVVFPALSTGIFGFDAKESTKIAIDTVNESLKTCKNLKEVTFCCFDTDSERAYLREIAGGSSSPSDSTQSNVVDIPSRFASRPNRIASTNVASLEKLSINPRSLPQIPPQLSITSTSIVEINDVDAIVNPTDTVLSCGGIVSELIVDAFNGNDNFQKSIKKLNCKPEGAVMDDTKFGASQVKVVHVAGPTFNSDDRVHSMKSLASTYQAAIKLADKNGCKSIAIPAISTGTQGFPMEESAMVAVSSVNAALKDCDNLHKVQFCCFGPKATSAYESALDAVDTDLLKPAAKPSTQTVQSGNSEEPGSDLSRFSDALSDTVVQGIKNQLENGTKTEHWMGFAFPQIRGLSESPEGERFGVKDVAEAKEFLNDKDLGSKLREFTGLAVSAAFNTGKEGPEAVEEVFGALDAQKFHACMTLFSLAEKDSSSEQFKDVLGMFYGGKQHELTNIFLGR